MRNQYKILAEKYEQVNQEGRKPGIPKVTPYKHSDGTIAYKSLTKWGKRQDWRTSAAAHKAAGIPEPKSEPKQEIKKMNHRDVEFMNDNDFEYNGTPYEVQAKFEWNGDRAVDTEWLQVMDIDGNVATDPKLLQAAKAFALDMVSADPDRYTQYHQNEDTDPYGSRNAPPITVPPEQTRSIRILLNMGFEFSSWIKTGYEDDPETKTAVLTRIRGYRRSVVEVTPDGRGNGQLVAEDGQMKEMMEPVDDKPDAEDRVADGIAAKLDMTDKSDDSVSQVLSAYWKELEAEWKQYHPTQSMPEDVKEELWHSIHKGMEQAGVDPTEY
jgi:hypothetical protein